MLIAKSNRNIPGWSTSLSELCDFSPVRLRGCKNTTSFPAGCRNKKLSWCWQRARRV